MYIQLRILPRHDPPATWKKASTRFVWFSGSTVPWRICRYAVAFSVLAVSSFSPRHPLLGNDSGNTPRSPKASCRESLEAIATRTPRPLWKHQRRTIARHGILRSYEKCMRIELEKKHFHLDTYARVFVRLYRSVLCYSTYGDKLKTHFLTESCKNVSVRYGTRERNAKDAKHFYIL